jgi:hypothetical protein
MASQNHLVFKPGDVFTFVDQKGHEILTVSFDMEPGSNLVNLEVFDTDGMPIVNIGASYLGAGYPQCATPQQQTFINRVERSTLPKREPQPPFKVVEASKQIESERQELDPDDPKSETWCNLSLPVGR